jgi:hypothetical protein
MIKKFLRLMSGAAQDEKKQIDHYRSLIRQEAAIGATVFGPIPQGGHREFFCLDESTWIWHEEWTDQAGIRQSRTTRYEVRPDAILKAQNNGTYKAVDIDEENNLIEAAKMYHDKVLSQVYGMAVAA